MIVLTGAAASVRAGDASRPSRKDRARWAGEREAAFASEVGSLLDELATHGATEIEPLWLNRTVAARLALAGIEAAARRPETRQIILSVRRVITA